MQKIKKPLSIILAVLMVMSVSGFLSDDNLEERVL